MPTPPAVTGIVAVTHPRRKITAIVLGFNEALDPASAGNGGLYNLAAGVTKKHRLLFTKGVKIGAISYDGMKDTVTLRLARPTKGPIQVTAHGGIKGANGASSAGDFTTVVASTGRRGHRGGGTG
jgi:hypothetical protein